MRGRFLTLLLTIYCFVLGVKAQAQCSCNDSLVTVAINRIISSYPKATLQDIYKSFFQEQFGPGHIISDTAVVKRYLNAELAQFGNNCPATCELTGITGEYVRVGLGYIVKGMISDDVYLDAFIRSANNVQPISIEDWRKEWSQVIAVIESMDLKLENYEADKLNIKRLMDSGKYVMHHSAIYRELYHPHYRIIKKSIFEKDILPHIIKHSNKL